MHKFDVNADHIGIVVTIDPPDSVTSHGEATLRFIVPESVSDDELFELLEERLGRG